FGGAEVAAVAVGGNEPEDFHEAFFFEKSGRQTMSATRTGLGIRPRRWKASATRCWSATVVGLSGPTGEGGRRCRNRLTTPASSPLKSAISLMACGRS